MYLSQFDTFVRHKLGPLGYLRYGDDFLIFGRNQQNIEAFQVLALRQLASMGLKVNAQQDIVVRAWQGLHFLGHRVAANELFVEPKTARRALEKLMWQNLASYSSLYLPQTTKQKIIWELNFD